MYCLEQACDPAEIEALRGERDAAANRLVAVEADSSGCTAIPRPQLTVMVSRDRGFRFLWLHFSPKAPIGAASL